MLPSAVEPPDSGGQYRGEGAPRRVGRQRQSGPPVGLRGPACKVCAAGRQDRGAQRGCTELVIAEEEPTPSHVEQQVHAQRRGVTAGLFVLFGWRKRGGVRRGGGG